MLVVTLAVALLGFGGGYLARQIPFAQELAWSKDFGQLLESQDGKTPEYLNALADRLLAAHPLEAGMRVRVHYADSELVNAFATLGGNIVIHRGLLEVLPSENALAMVLAHEIAHVRERHPIEVLGRTAAVSLFLALLNVGSDAGVDLLSRAGSLTVLKFNRAQETRADAIALEMVADLYGHVADADDFFRRMQAEQHGAERWVPEFLSTHPLHEGRIAALHRLAAERGWSFAGEPVPLPGVAILP